MITASGRHVTQQVGAPSLEDVALGLSRQPRFGGQSRMPWSVAHHSLVCHHIAKQEGASQRLQLLCLLHDAHEALTGDVPTSLKTADFRAMQHALDERLFGEWGVPMPNEDEARFVALVDGWALRAEGEQVGPAKWPTEVYGVPSELHREIVREVCWRERHSVFTRFIETASALLSCLA
jgi:hypothetical protein